MNKLVNLSIGALLLTASIAPAFAAGGSSSSKPAPQPALNCKSGEVVKKVKVNGNTCGDG